MAGNGSPKTGGRKKGTPNKATADTKAAFQKHGMKFVTAMVELTKHKDPHIQLKALQICLDRGYGRPPLAVAIGGDPDAHLQRPRRRHGFDRCDDLQARADGTLGVVLMGLRPAEVDHEAVAQVLRHVALVPPHDSAAGLLVGRHQRPQVLRVKLLGECG